jgi:hypothetical protein
MRPAGTIRPITTSCQPRRVNRARADSSFSADCRRANQAAMALPPPRAAANVTRSPMSAPSVETSTTSTRSSRSVLTAIAAPAPTTAPVGMTGMIDPISTPPNTTG